MKRGAVSPLALLNDGEKGVTFAMDKALFEQVREGEMLNWSGLIALRAASAQVSDI